MITQNEREEGNKQQREVKESLSGGQGPPPAARRDQVPHSRPPRYYSYEATHSRHYRYFKVRHPIKLKYRAIRRCEASITVI